MSDNRRNRFYENSYFRTRQIVIQGYSRDIYESTRSELKRKLLHLRFKKRNDEYVKNDVIRQLKLSNIIENREQEIYDKSKPIKEWFKHLKESGKCDHYEDGMLENDERYQLELLDRPFGIHFFNMSYLNILVRIENLHNSFEDFGYDFFEMTNNLNQIWFKSDWVSFQTPLNFLVKMYIDNGEIKPKLWNAMELIKREFIYEMNFSNGDWDIICERMVNLEYINKLVLDTEKTNYYFKINDRFVYFEAMVFIFIIKRLFHLFSHKQEPQHHRQDLHYELEFDLVKRRIYVDLVDVFGYNNDETSEDEEDEPEKAHTRLIEILEKKENDNIECYNSNCFICDNDKLVYKCYLSNNKHDLGCLECIKESKTIKCFVCNQVF